MRATLIDAGPLIAYLDQSDDWHPGISELINSFAGQFITTAPVVTEVMWHLRSDWRVQNELLHLISTGVLQDEPLTAKDFARIAELNMQYADQESDFADLSLLAISERLDLTTIVSFDKEFDYYKRRKGNRHLILKRTLP